MPFKRNPTTNCPPPSVPVKFVGFLEELRRRAVELPWLVIPLPQISTRLYLKACIILASMPATGYRWLLMLQMTVLGLGVTIFSGSDRSLQSDAVDCLR
jgi:hypothetical protein